MSLHEDIAVTAELCGTNLSEAAALVLTAELAAYDRQQVLGALRRCRRELKGRLTMAEILSRLDDGRPGPEEAWAMLPMSESQTAVWTEEMRGAFAVALPLLEAGDKIPARMAFKEAYQLYVSASRDVGDPVIWSATLGHDVRGRESVLLAAVEAGRLPLETARIYCPELPAPSADVAALCAPVAKIAQ